MVFSRRAPVGAMRAAGRLAADVLAPLLLPGVTAYVCGSTGFADHASDLLVELGHPTADIRVERYGATS